MVVDDEEHVRLALRTVLQKEGYAIAEAANGHEAIAQLEKYHGSLQLLLLDIQMPGLNGRGVQQFLRKKYPWIEVIFMTAYSTPENVMGAMREGAYEFLTKPFDIQEIKRLVRQVMAARQADNRAADGPQMELNRPETPWGGLIGTSPKMQEVYKLIGRVAATSASVLIEGESGTGKELICRAIHANSLRSSGPLVEVNCGAIPEHLLESELFGHEKGAFTGALQSRRGKFELADGGTLFLDEIGEMPLWLQVKLLRVLQEKEIERVGGESKRKVDVRIVAATHRNLRQLVEEGRFREDLYYRLNVVAIQVPPLRERREDIPLLAAHFFEKYVKETGKRLRGIAREAEEWLCGYQWPGNVRELQNVIQRAVILAQGPYIQLEHVVQPQQRAEAGEEGQEGAPLPVTGGRKLKELLREVEREAILAALRETGGNKAQASLRLGISRKALIYKCQEYGIS
nr:sigma-54 dependent transcriptional regulator [Brevibacillus sp. SYP-B805]